MLPALKKYQSSDVQVNRFQEEVAKKFTELTAPFITGRYLTIVANQQETNVIPLTTTATNFEHKLGREPEGFIVVYLDGNAVIWWDRTTTEDRSLFIRLDASANVNAKIWIY